MTGWECCGCSAMGVVGVGGCDGVVGGCTVIDVLSVSPGSVLLGSGAVYGESGSELIWRLFRLKFPLGVETTCMYERNAGWPTICPFSWRSGRKTVLPMDNIGNSLEW